MQDTKGDYKTHVFVCTHKRDGKESCSQRGAEELRKELKDWTKENPDWRKKIRINNSGCLDRCKEGIAIALYPQNRWLLDVDGEDTKDIEKVKAAITEIMNQKS